MHNLGGWPKKMFKRVKKGFKMFLNIIKEKNDSEEIQEKWKRLKVNYCMVNEVVILTAKETYFSGVHADCTCCISPVFFLTV